MVSCWLSSVSVCLSICLLYVHVSLLLFPDNNLSKYKWIITKLGVSLILWRSGLELPVGKFCKSLTKLSVREMSLFSFSDDNLSNCQWIFTKFGIYLNIVEIWFGIVIAQISSVFDRVISWRRVHIFISGG